MRACLSCCLFKDLHLSDASICETCFGVMRLFILDCFVSQMNLVEADMKTGVSDLKPTCTSTSYWQSGREDWVWSATDFFLVCFRGVLSVSWCQADPELLLSSAKDNRILCWNPSTGEVLNSYKYTLSSSNKTVCYIVCLPPTFFFFFCICVDCQCVFLQYVFCAILFWLKWQYCPYPD